MSRVCVKCRRVIDMNDMTINEGKPYHDHCSLQIIRSKIAVLSDKMGKRTATVLEDIELKDLLYMENIIKRDIELQKDIELIPKKPVFFGNTPLGKHSAMNSPQWKQILAKRKSLEGTKYHMYKVPEPPTPTIEPIWQITTDENGYKGVIQIGTRPLTPLSEMNKEKLSAGQTSVLVVQNKYLIDYEAERIVIDIWRGFELLDELVPNSNLLDLNARVVTLNKERNQQVFLEVSA